MIFNKASAPAIGNRRNIWVIRPLNSENLSPILSIILIVVLVLVNFTSKPLEINDICDDLVITLDNNEAFDISKDSNSTLLYFCNEIDEEEINLLKTYKEDNLNILLISKNVLEIDDETKLNLTNLNIKFAVDSKESIFNKFVSKKQYPYTIFTDSSDKILIKTKGGTQLYVSL